MKLFVKFMIFLLVLAAAGPFLMKGPDGRPLMSLKDLSMPSFSLDNFLPKEMKPAPVSTTDNSDPGNWIEWTTEKDLPAPDYFSAEQLAGLEIQEKSGLYYRWKDENGVWQFSSLPNKNTENWVVQTDPNANVLQGLSEEQIDRAFGRVSAVDNENLITKNNPFAKGEEPENTFPVPTTVPMTNIPDLIKQAESVQDIMDKRVKQMEQMTGR